MILMWHMYLGILVAFATSIPSILLLIFIIPTYSYIHHRLNSPLSLSDWKNVINLFLKNQKLISEMEALIEEAVEPSNTNFEIDLVQTMNEKIMNEKLRSGMYLFFSQKN